VLEPVEPIEPYQERLPCMEPISTATGIEIALKQLLEIVMPSFTRGSERIKNRSLQRLSG
jgi:hypothetical protein